MDVKFLIQFRQAKVTAYGLDLSWYGGMVSYPYARFVINEWLTIGPGGKPVNSENMRGFKSELYRELNQSYSKLERGDLAFLNWRDSILLGSPYFSINHELVHLDRSISHEHDFKNTRRFDSDKRELGLIWLPWEKLSDKKVINSIPVVGFNKFLDLTIKQYFDNPQIIPKPTLRTRKENQLKSFYLTKRPSIMNVWPL